MYGFYHCIEMEDYYACPGRPKRYVCHTFLMLIFCCPVIGIIALIYAFQVSIYVAEFSLDNN